MLKNERLLDLYYNDEDILEGCKKKDAKEDVIEEVDFSDVETAFEVDFDTELGGFELHEGDLVEIDSVNFIDKVVYITIHSESDNMDYTDIAVDFDDIVEFSENHTPITIIEDENDELDDADIDEIPVEEVAPLGVALLGEAKYKIRGGKKVKVNQALQKKRDKLKASGQNKKYKIDSEGNKVRKSKEEIKAQKLAGKRMTKDASKYERKRAKSLKKSKELNEDMLNPETRDFVGVTWGDLDFKDRSRFLKDAECIPVFGKELRDGEKCLVHSVNFPYAAVSGTYIEDGIPEVNDRAVIFDCATNETCRSVDEGCKSKANESVIDLDEFETSFVVGADTVLGGMTLYAGEIVDITKIDFEDREVEFDVYDENGNLVKDDIDAPFAEIFSFSEENDYAYDDIEEVAPLGVALLGEAKYKIRGGKKVKVNQALQKKRDKLKASGQNKKYKIDSEGRKVKKSAKEIKAGKMAGKRMAKNASRYNRKRAKSQKLARRLAESAFNFDAYDINDESNVTIFVHEGDYVVVDEGMLSLIRDGECLIDGIEVDDDIIEEFVSEGVVSDEEATDEEIFPEDDAEIEDEDENTDENTDEDGEIVDEAHMLTHTVDSGYLLIREGKEIPLGNRIRARNFLEKNGYRVTKDMLDEAYEGSFIAL